MTVFVACLLQGEDSLPIFPGCLPVVLQSLSVPFKGLSGILFSALLLHCSFFPLHISGESGVSSINALANGVRIRVFRLGGGGVLHLSGVVGVLVSTTGLLAKYAVLMGRDGDLTFSSLTMPKSRGLRIPLSVKVFLPGEEDVLIVILVCGCLVSKSSCVFAKRLEWLPLCIGAVLLAEEDTSISSVDSVSFIGDGKSVMLDKVAFDLDVGLSLSFLRPYKMRSDSSDSLFLTEGIRRRLLRRDGVFPPALLLSLLVFWPNDVLHMKGLLSLSRQPTSFMGPFVGLLGSSS